MIIYLLFRIKKILIGSESRNFVKYEVEKKKKRMYYVYFYTFINIWISMFPAALSPYANSSRKLHKGNDSKINNIGRNWQEYVEK